MECHGVQGKAKGRARRPRGPRIARASPLALLTPLGLLALPLAFPCTPWQSIKLPYLLIVLDFPDVQSPGSFCRDHLATNRLSIPCQKKERPYSVRFFFLLNGMAPPGFSRLLLATTGSSWHLLARPGSSWLPLALPGSAWLLLIFLALCGSS